MIKIYELSTSGELQIVDDTKEGLTTSLADERTNWIRAIEINSAEVNSIRDSLALSDEVMDALLEHEGQAGVVTYDDVLLMSLPVLLSKEERTVALRVACTPTTLITAEPYDLSAVDRVASERFGAVQSSVTLTGLLAEILEAVVSDINEAAYLTLRRKVDRIDDIIHGDVFGVAADELLDVRRKVEKLSMLWEEQRYGLKELLRRHAYMPPSKNVLYLLRDLVADADRGLGQIARLSKILSELRQHQVQCLHESSSRRLNILTILSAIFLPATLISGIFGMNFVHIPGTQWLHGFDLVIAFMVVLALGQLLYFYLRGWFK